MRGRQLSSSGVCEGEARSHKGSVSGGKSVSGSVNERQVT